MRFRGAISTTTGTALCGDAVAARPDLAMPTRLEPGCFVRLGESDWAGLSAQPQQCDNSSP